MLVASAVLFVAFFVFPDLPMVNLPQHAAQIATWLRLDQGDPATLERFELNFRTPYLVAYPLARALAPVLGVVAALKLVVWASVVATMLAVRGLAARLGHDPWLCLVGLVSACGLCFYFGFVSFLAAVPLGIFALSAAIDHARAPSLARGLAVALFTTLTLVAHGVALPMVLGTAGLVLCRGTGKLLVRLAPLAVPLVVAFAWFFPGPAAQRIGGDLWNPLPGRWLDFPALLTSMGASDHFSLVLGMALLALVLLSVGAKASGALERRLPLALFFLGYGLFPEMFRGVVLLHTRLPAFFLPVLLLAFVPRAPKRSWLVGVTRAGLGLATAFWLGVFVWRLAAFNRESAGFHALTSELRPGLAMRPLIFERNSRVFPGVPAYLHYSAYYYVEKGGRQGYSFAMYPISVVRYRPAVKVNMQNAAEWRPDRFDGSNEVAGYDYFLVRSAEDREDKLFSDAPEPVVLDNRHGDWWGYAPLEPGRRTAAASAGREPGAHEL